MLSISSKSMYLNKLIGISAASLLLVSQAASSLGDPANEQGMFKFEAVDINNDDQLSWNEISHPYEDQLSSAGWDQQDVIGKFDHNNDNYLSENEYQEFTSSLQNNIDGSQGVAASQSESQQQGQQQVQLPGISGDHMQQNEQQRNQQAQSQSQSQNQGQAQAQAGGQQQGIEPAAVVTILTVDDASQQVSLQDLEDRKVVNLQGEEIGEVEDVVRSTVGNDTGLVVSVGGFWDIGDEELYFSMDQFRLQGDQLVLQTRLDADAIEESDAFSYNEENYTSIVEEYQAAL